jgi:uncharacterized protein with NRDE domain
VCTVVCRWQPADAYPVQLMAVRDERRRRAFDPPGPWWPEQPQVIGGRDRQAGGSWCVSELSTGVTGVVLNRPERREAAPGAPSRGALPLLAVTRGARWLEHIELEGMASFNLVLAQPAGLRWWSYDGERLTAFELDPGTHQFKPNGIVSEPLDPRLISGRAQLADPDAPVGTAWSDWLDILSATAPSADGTGLLVQRELDDGDFYESVFAQFIAARPSTLRLDYLIAPLARPADWLTRRWDSSRAP